MSLLAIAMAAAMPLPPPQNIIRGFGNIPEMRGGPMRPWQAQTIPAMEWSCEGQLLGEPFQIQGRASSIEIVPANGAIATWDPYGLVSVESDSLGQFSGTFLATYSGDIYGFRLAADGDAYEFTIRFDDGYPSGRFEARRWLPVQGGEWSSIGSGTCTGHQLGHSEELDS